MQKPRDWADFSWELGKLFCGRMKAAPGEEEVEFWWETLADLPLESVVAGIRRARRQPGWISEGDVREAAVRAAREQAQRIENERQAKALAETVPPWTDEQRAEFRQLMAQWGSGLEAHGEQQKRLAAHRAGQPRQLLLRSVE